MRKLFSSCFRCFAKDQICSFQQSGTKCNIISVNDDGEAIFHHILSSEPSSSLAVIKKSKPNPKPYKKLVKEPKPLEKAFNVCCTNLPDISESSSQSSENHLVASYNDQKLKMVAEPPRDQGISTSTASTSTHPQLINPFGISQRKVFDPNFVLGLPLKLSKEVIEEITLGFIKRISSDENQQFVVYEGFFAVSRSRVLVKMFRGDSGGMFLGAEMKAALSMSHKNIMRLIGYHQSDNSTFLVFPFAERGTLDSNLNGELYSELYLSLISY